MNLIKLSEQLKDVPDNYLAQEIQQPTGKYPAYLIISELSRRKRMRDGVAKPEPQTTVAEDLTGQGGLADTPQAMQSTAGMDVMGAEEPEEMPQMAGGGLVAFQRGNLVRQSLAAEDDLRQAGYQMSFPVNQSQYQSDDYAREFPDVRELPGIYRQIQEYSTPISEERRTSLREEGRRRRAEEVPFGREEEARRIASREKALEGERASNVNMALMEAGLGMMASRAPRGIQGVAEGGLKGLSALRAGKQEIKKSEAYLDQARENYARAQELYDEKKYAAGDKALQRADQQQAFAISGAQAKIQGIKAGIDIERGEEMHPLLMEKAQKDLQFARDTYESRLAEARLLPKSREAQIAKDLAAANLANVQARVGGFRSGQQPKPMLGPGMEGAFKGADALVMSAQKNKQDIILPNGQPLTGTTEQKKAVLASLIGSGKVADFTTDEANQKIYINPFGFAPAAQISQAPGVRGGKPDYSFNQFFSAD